MEHRNLKPGKLRLQFFAEGGAEAGLNGKNEIPKEGNVLGGAAGEGTRGTGAAIPGNASSAVDYEKIQKMLEGTLAAKEDTVLKAYFKQQGLSQGEAEQAMAAFKAEKAKNQPDVAAIRTQLAKAQEEVQRAQIENVATMVAVSLGVEAKTIPYLIKMADLGQVVGTDGKVNEENVKKALDAVLEAVPGLKPQTAGSTGFVQVGAGGNGQQQRNDDALKKAFGL
ncbi:MAG: hypothetical protein K2O03_09590 [Lachnospiraceae bacterium]|nr:hypothetical protein [Lachnospiraceae bacterium]